MLYNTCTSGVGMLRVHPMEWMLYIGLLAAILLLVAASHYILGGDRRILTIKIRRGKVMVHGRFPKAQLARIDAMLPSFMDIHSKRADIWVVYVRDGRANMNVRQYSRDKKVRIEMDELVPLQRELLKFDPFTFDDGEC